MCHIDRLGQDARLFGNENSRIFNDDAFDPVWNYFLLICSNQYTFLSAIS